MRVRVPMEEFLPQTMYKGYLRQGADWEANAWKASLNAAQLTKLEEFSVPVQFPTVSLDSSNWQAVQRQVQQEIAQRQAFTKGLLRNMTKAMWSAERRFELLKAGVTTSLGYNFYDLRSPVFFLYPVNVPMRNQIARTGRVNDGFGTAAHWKATRNPGSVYAGVLEGQRGAAGTPDENDYVSTYKEFAFERAVTFTAQFAGEGFTDNLADEHQRGLHVLMLQEEGLIWNGNGGTAVGNNGLQLGTCPTPTTAVAVTGTNGTGTVIAPNAAGTAGSAIPYTAQFTTSNYVSVACVLLTAMGNPSNNQYGYGTFPTVAGGLAPTSARTNADGTTQNVVGGMSAISLISNVTQLTTGHLTIYATFANAVLPIKGAFGYAWFVDTETSNTGSLANAKLAGITTTPYAYINGSATGTQLGNATGLNTDYSAAPSTGGYAPDFTGLIYYAASTTGSYWSDLGANQVVNASGNLSLTSGKDGTCNELEAALLYFFQNFQVCPDEIWGDPLAILCLDKAIRWGGTSPSGYQFITMRDAQNNLLGGYVVSAYQSRYAVGSPTGGLAIPIRIHPMVPPGTLYFHFKTNPYPQSRLPQACDMLVQREYYSIEWPIVTRTWTFGTYVHEVFRHLVPWLSGAITGVGNFVQN